ncbi:MAG: asparaginase [Flavobacteriales bacterium]
MKKILLIYTGGTIGMIQKNNSLSPFDFDNLKNAIPEIKDCGSDVQHISLENPIDSSNMNIKYWRELSSCIYNHYDRYDGFVILHGSDTMAYTASMLSFMFENVNKAIILTGSQLPIGIKRSDAKENLITSIEIASSAIINEVCVYFEYQLFRGNRVVKVNADNFDAFKSPNYPILAQAGVKIKYQKQYLNTGNNKKLKLFSQISNDVSILKIFPSVNKKFVKSVLNSSKGIILESFGSGNATTEKWFLDELESAINNGKIIINISQCLSGSVQQGDYQTSILLKKIGVISGHDMTTEAALTKLMHLLGQNFSDAKVKQKITSNLRGEITI